MTKADLGVAAKQSYVSFSKADGDAMVDYLLRSMQKALNAGEKIDLRGFGVFTVKETKARKGRNPKTGEAMQIPARKKVVFKASKDLLNA